MSEIYGKSGGYRKLLSFNLTCIVHLGTRRFCKRFINWKEDPLGKTVGQMVGASRSGKQNIVEGSERAATSAETEIKLLDVARASLAELQGDLEDYLVDLGQVPWSKHSQDYNAISAVRLETFEYTDDLLHDHWTYVLDQKKKYDLWLEHEDASVVANALIFLALRARALLGRQMQSLEKTFLETGGMRERMSYARKAARDETEVSEADSPECQQCGEKMQQRNSQKGPFWGCLAFPDCRGTRAM